MKLQKRIFWNSANRSVLLNAKALVTSATLDHYTTLFNIERQLASTGFSPTWRYDYHQDFSIKCKVNQSIIIIALTPIKKTTPLRDNMKHDSIYQKYLHFNSTLCESKRRDDMCPVLYWLIFKLKEKIATARDKKKNRKTFLSRRLVYHPWTVCVCISVCMRHFIDL